MEMIITRKREHEFFARFLPLASGFRRQATAVLAAGVLWLTSSAPVCAQTFNNLVNFNGTNGFEPLYGSLAQGRDGNLWGTTCQGGANSLGTVFSMTPSGTLTTIYNFGSTTGDGSCPYAPPILGTDGNFYGTTYTGTVYKLTPGGVLTVLANVSADGLGTSALVQGRDGSFYGVTYAFTSGTVFKVTPTGILTILHTSAGLME